MESSAKMSHTTAENELHIDILAQVAGVPVPALADATTIVVTLPPGSEGSSPHRHPGPVFGYVLEGEVIFEVAGHPERIVKAGETFWELGGEVIHYRDANNLPNAQTRFVAVILTEPSRPIVIPVSDDELAARQHLRAPRGSTESLSSTRIDPR
ncbi:cupin domain-containing protein [Rhodococcus sp. G-MC3]|uniref:cupin domain-containing protein n=1 Tax=Rhodococcus sp. G-MC3 TaxID=3046209 RepID=UPI0024BA081C|nr:cupin domain-containing protein [Rhodococcus sp. G-MC3]MDJ0396233.1 cupin domain-containing protein [Rhodococcus sp. G-MC3]